MKPRVYLIRKKNIWTIGSVLAILFLILWLFFEVISTSARDGNELGLTIRRFIKIENGSEYVNKKKILFWNTFFEDDWFGFGKNCNEYFENCENYKNCYITRTRNLIDVEKFDAIVFHGNQLTESDVPAKRDQKQLWIFANLESPSNRPLAERFFENLFNLTMTYRIDSDIPWPYYVFRHIDTGEVVAPRKNVTWIQPFYDPILWFKDIKFDKKTQTSAWLVSNLVTHGKREIFVDELSNYMKVEKIGRFRKPMISDCAGTYESCFNKVIEPNYFFYLSFENSLCQEYVTEKFYNALSHDVVPVVYGGANYSLFAPPHSYIDALDFDGPKALADYLIELSQNRKEYLKYFWWKRFYTIGSSNRYTLCKLCERLNDDSVSPKRYAPLSEWFEMGKCPIENYLKTRKYATKEVRREATGL